IPINGNNILCDFDAKSGEVNLSVDDALVWGANVHNARLLFMTKSKPMEYHFDFEYIKNFDLMNFDIVRTSLNGSAEVNGQSFGDDMRMEISAALGKSSFEKFDFDSAYMHITFMRDSVILGNFSKPSRIYAGGNSILLWGKFNSDGNLNIAAKGQFYHPQYFAKYLDLDYMPTGVFDVDVNISGKSQRPSAGFVIKGNNAEIKGLRFSSITASGNFSDIKHFQGDLTIYADSGKYGNYPIDSLYASITTGLDKVFFRPLSFKSKGGKIRMTGTIFSGDTTKIKVAGLSFTDSLETILLDKPVIIAIKNGGVSASDVYFSAFDGNVIVDTFFMGDSLLIIRGSLEDISLDRTSYFMKQLHLSGRAKGHYSLIMNTRTMFGNGRINIVSAPFILNGFSWNSLSAECKYTGDTLSITMLHLRRSGEIADVSGSIVFIDRVPYLDLSLSAKGDNLYSITNFTNFIEPIRGTYGINLIMSGRSDSLSLSGNVSIDNASLNLSPIDDPLDSIYFRGSFHNNSMIIDTFSARMSTESPRSAGLLSRIWSFFVGRKKISGYVSADGGINFTSISSPVFAVDTKIKNVPLKSISDGFFFITDGELSIRGQEPRISGDISISQGNLLRLGSVSPEPSHTPMPIDISITADNLWILTNEIEGKISGELFITNSGENISILGQLNFDNGKYFIYGQNFDIESGILDFKKIGNIDPELDVLAKTIIGNEEIYLHITGTLSQPKLEITSTNPDYTPEELLQLLSGSTDTVGVREVLEDRTQYLLQRYVEHQLENIARTTLGVDEIEIEPAGENANILNPSEMRLTVGKQVAGKLYIKYSQVLSSDPQQEIELQYRLSKNLTIGALEDADRNYRLKLDLKWQY
ncbi:hypothetical protein DRQ26_01975, partial [bacterium]